MLRLLKYRQKKCWKYSAGEAATVARETKNYSVFLPEMFTLFLPLLMLPELPSIPSRIKAESVFISDLNISSILLCFADYIGL